MNRSLFPPLLPALIIAIAALGGWTAAPARAETVVIPATFSGPMTLGGTAGGSDRGPCGFQGAGSNDQHLLEVATPQQLTLEIAEAQHLNLYIDGPGGEFCIQATGGTITFPGFWSPGTYRLAIATQATDVVRPYQLTVSSF
ncbi:MAG: hypothetical protein Fur0042_32180 [Cyanophyceae cyanobacterium]